MRSRQHVLCKLLWKLCRGHGWAGALSEDALVDLALESSSQGQARDLVEELIHEPYITFQNGKGYRVKNDPDSQAQAAARLKQSCGYTDIQIEPTLSRFEQAGGFDAYDMDTVSEQLDPW